MNLDIVLNNFNESAEALIKKYPDEGKPDEIKYNKYKAIREKIITVAAMQSNFIKNYGKANTVETFKDEYNYFNNLFILKEDRAYEQFVQELQALGDNPEPVAYADLMEDL